MAPVVSMRSWEPVVRSGAEALWAGFGEQAVDDGGGSAGEGAVGSVVVVELDEVVEQGLEVGEGLGWGLFGEPAFEGLLEALYLPAGGGVVGAGVLLADPEGGEDCLEGVAAAAATGEAGGVHHGVVGQHRGGKALLSGCSSEGVHDDGAGDGSVGGNREGVAGVVIEPGEDLAVGAIPETPVGEVRLPALIRQVGLEPDIGGPRSLLGFRGDQPGGQETAADRGR